MSRRVYLIVLVLFVFENSSVLTEEEKSVEEEQYGVKYASRCEVCKYLVVELENRLKETGKTHDVIEIGYGLDDNKKKIKYTKSELRLEESLDGICDRLLEYNIHKERDDSTRFAKGMSTTFKVLHGLVDKGVKVELGIPYDLWDRPSAEVSHLKTQCENLLEQHEDDITRWYYHHQNVPLRQYLCIDRALRKGDDGCLDETFLEKPKEEEEEPDKKGEKPKKKKKSTKDKKDVVEDAVKQKKGQEEEKEAEQTIDQKEEL